MDNELLKKILSTFEEEKLAALIESLSEEEMEHLSSLYEDEAEKDSSEQDPTEAEKVAADWYAAGKVFGAGFVDSLNQSEK